MEVLSLNEEFEDCLECFAIVEPKVGVKLHNCKHCICKPCLRRSILDNTGSPSVNCPREGCRRLIPLWEIEAVLSKREYSFYLEASGSSGTAGRIPTPGPSCVEINNNNLPTSSSFGFNSGKDTSQEGPHFSLKTVLEGDSESTVPERCGTNPFKFDLDQPSSSASSSSSGVKMKHRSVKYENLETSELLTIAFNPEPSDCGFCGVNLRSGKGILLQACSHIFCKECLQGAVGGSSGDSVSCPGGCGQSLYDTEIKTIVSSDEYESYRRRQVDKSRKRTVGKDQRIFQCKTPGCEGLCVPEDESRIFLCEICNRQNCMRCETIHDGIPCERWKRLRLESDRSGQMVNDEELLARSEDFGYKQISRTVQEFLQGFPKDDLALYYDAAESIFQQSAVIPTVDHFECLICTNMTSEEETGGGFLLQQCSHAFCRSCLQNVVNIAEDIPVPCPYVGEEGRCKEFLTPAEFKALASEEVFEKHVRWGWSIAEDILQKKFRCLERSCKGFWEIEENAPTGIYLCPVCRRENCVRCNTIHGAKTCAQVQDELRKEAQQLNDDENRKLQKKNEQASETEVNRLIKARRFMRCPFCGFVCEKISGCAHVVCLNRGCKKKFNWYK